MTERQIQREIERTYKTMYRRIERFVEALDAPSLNLVGPVEIDEVYRLCNRVRSRFK